jgi:hypothetical protein
VYWFLESDKGIYNCKPTYVMEYSAVIYVYTVYMGLMYIWYCLESVFTTVYMTMSCRTNPLLMFEHVWVCMTCTSSVVAVADHEVRSLRWVSSKDREHNILSHSAQTCVKNADIRKTVCIYMKSCHVQIFLTGKMTFQATLKEPRMKSVLQEV